MLLLKVLVRSFYLLIGEIDRRKLGKCIFHEKAKKDMIDKLTLQFIVPRIKGMAKSIADNNNIVIIDAPLLFEMELDEFCDMTIGVIASKESCIDRICFRDMIDEEDAEARMSYQHDITFFKMNCDYCINNEFGNNLACQINRIFDGNNLSNRNIIHLYDEGIEFLQFRRLLEFSESIEHCYTLKPLDFNIGDENKAFNDYDRICQALGLDSNNIYRPKQTHSNNVIKVESEIAGIYQEPFQDVDGLITDKPNKILSLTYADCICLYFYDPVKNVIGNIHSGWKGTYKEIAKTAITKLNCEYGVNPEDLICAIGPNIRSCCFEVKQDVRDMFYEKFKNTGRIDEIIQKSSNNNKYYIDTVLINRIILNREGLKEENIIDNGICTKCNSNLLHSYRVEKEFAGRNTGLITLKDRKG